MSNVAWSQRISRFPRTAVRYSVHTIARWWKNWSALVTHCYAHRETRGCGLLLLLLLLYLLLHFLLEEGERVSTWAPFTFHELSDSFSLSLCSSLLVSLNPFGEVRRLWSKSSNIGSPSNIFRWPISTFSYSGRQQGRACLKFYKAAEATLCRHCHWPSNRLSINSLISCGRNDSVPGINYIMSRDFEIVCRTDKESLLRWILMLQKFSIFLKTTFFLENLYYI